jgi:GxxExxY protein
VTDLNTEVAENTETGIVFETIDRHSVEAWAATHMNTINELTEKIVGAAIEVHRAIGPGLLESAYESCLARELFLRGLACARQVAVPLTYKGEIIDVAFRADLIVEDAVLVELKAIETVLPVHRAQVLSYIRETDHPVGLLINFHVPRLVDGITRLASDR